MGINLKLHLGVVQVPEWGNSQWDSYDVAKHLEESYGLYSGFVEYEGQKIADLLADSVAGSMETLLQGGVVKDPFKAGTEQITEDFREFISSQKAEQELAAMTEALREAREKSEAERPIYAQKIKELKELKEQARQARMQQDQDERVDPGLILD